MFIFILTFTTEYLNSRFSQTLIKKNPQQYIDKLRASNNLDEIISASKNYVEESPKHKSSHNFTSFSRGDVLLQIGKNKYKAEVVVGYTTGNSMVFYDLVNLNRANFTIREVDVREGGVVHNVKPPRSGASTSESIIQQIDPAVNNNFKKNPKNTKEQHKISDETIRNNYFANTFDYEERATYSGETIREIQTDKTVHISKSDITKWQCATNFKGNHLGGVSSSKDLSRNLDSIAGTNKMIRAFLKNEIETPFFHAKANFANDLTSKVDEFYHTVVELYGIKKGSKESAALQWYGEGKRQYFEYEDVDGKRKRFLSNLNILLHSLNETPLKHGIRLLQLILIAEKYIINMLKILMICL